ncbi:MAG: EamA family transporter [Thermoanaerobaculia bacterium]|nr:EamA family transporter [Thermoanaerobaculia bacterium]
MLPEQSSSRRSVLDQILGGQGIHASLKLSWSSPGRGLLAAVFAFLILVWGTTWGAITFSLEGFPPLFGLSLRFFLGSAILCAALVWRHEWQRPTPRLWGLWLSQTFFAFSVAYGITYWAEQWVPSGLVAVFFATFPLWVAVLGYFVLPEERLGLLGVIGLFLGFGGVAVIFSTDWSGLGGPGVAFAAAFTLISPLSAAVNQVWIKRWGRGFSPLLLTGPPVGAAAFLMLGLSALWEFGPGTDHTITPTWPAVAAVVYLGVPATAGAFGLYYWLMERVSAIRLSLITFATPVVAVWLGVAFLDEPLTVQSLLGAGLVLAGVGFVMLPRPHDRASTAKPD